MESIEMPAGLEQRPRYPCDTGAMPLFVFRAVDGRGKMLVQVGKLVADHESIGEMIQTVVRMVHNVHGAGFVLEKVVVCADNKMTELALHAQLVPRCHRDVGRNFLVPAILVVSPEVARSPPEDSAFCFFST